jgi:hypothetical protein
MRRVALVAVLVGLALAAGGCSSDAATQPNTSSNLSVLGASEGAGATSTAAPKPISPAASEHIPSSAGILVRAVTGPTKVSEASALEIARKVATTKGASGVAVVHVMVSSDASRPDSTQSSTNAVSAWMVTFHRVDLPSTGGAGGQTGSSTVLVDSETGKVIKKLDYVPVKN